MEDNLYKNIDRIIHVSTAMLFGCEHCDVNLGPSGFDFSVNHYIQEHGYNLLYLGRESSLGPDEKIIESTVAVLGRGPDDF